MDFAKFMVVLVFCISALASLLFWGGISLNRIGCRDTANGMGINHKYLWTTGCLVEPKPGQWIPLDSYKFIEE